jgi:hypothetical protein
VARKNGNGEGSRPRERAGGRWEARYWVGEKRRSVYGSTRKEAADRLVRAIANSEEFHPLHTDARPSPHVRHPTAVEGRPRQGGVGEAGSRQRNHHARHLQSRATEYAGGRCQGDGRGSKIVSGQRSHSDSASLAFCVLSRGSYSLPMVPGSEESATSGLSRSSLGGCSVSPGCPLLRSSRSTRAIRSWSCWSEASRSCWSESNC